MTPGPDEGSRPRRAPRRPGAPGAGAGGCGRGRGHRKSPTRRWRRSITRLAEQYNMERGPGEGRGTRRGGPEARWCGQKAERVVVESAKVGKAAKKSGQKDRQEGGGQRAAEGEEKKPEKKAAAEEDRQEDGGRWRRRRTKPQEAPPQRRTAEGEDRGISSRRHTVMV